MRSIIKYMRICLMGFTGLTLIHGAAMSLAGEGDLKQRLFEHVFGEAVRLDPQIIAQVKKMPPGKHLYFDTNQDGRDDQVWYIDSSPRHTPNVRPLLVRVIDEDGDFQAYGGPDLDSDLYIADWGADGRVDSIIDYVDTDGDQDVDEMGIYFFNPRYHFLGGKPALLVWWARDVGDDNLLWYDVNLTYQQSRCQYRCHFSGDEVFLNFGLLEGDDRWRSLWENPFAFYDPDGDTCSEVVVRLSGQADQVEALRYSIDVDDDAHGDRTHDYDFSLTAVAAGRYLPPGATGKVVSYPDSITSGMTLRGIPTQPWVQWEQARHFARQAPWSRVLLTWDELNANTEVDLRRDPHERWEGIINHQCEQFLQVGGPPTSALNKRNELSLNPTPPLQLYYDPSDRRLHLKGANQGWLHIDFDLDGRIDAKIEYLDQNRDGLFDRRRLDLEADGAVDFDWPMKPGKIHQFSLDFPSLSSFYRTELDRILADSQVFIDAARSALRMKKGMDSSSPVDTFFLEKLNTWMPATRLGERIRTTPAGARLYMDLRRDCLLKALRNIYKDHPAWSKALSLYVDGDYRAAARVVSRELAPAAEVIEIRKFREFSHRIPLKLDNQNGPHRDHWPISIPLREIRSRALDFNPQHCAIVTPFRRLDWHEIPHQIDEIDPAQGQELSFLADIRAHETTTYFLYYSPKGNRKTTFQPKTATARDWIPPNIGWESEQTAYREYWGQFDFFGKKTNRLIYPTIAATSYHNETEWGIDALLVGETSGLGGLTFYLDNRPFPVQNPAGKGAVKFQKRILTSGPVRAAVEVTAKNILPQNPDWTLRMVYLIYAERRESEIRLACSKKMENALLAVGLIKLIREEVFFDKAGGYLGAWGFQDQLIGDIGLGIIAPPGKIHDVKLLEKERHLLCDISPGTLRYWIIGDWRRGRPYPIAPNHQNWKRELSEMARKLHHTPILTIGRPESMAASPPTEGTEVHHPEAP